VTEERHHQRPYSPPAGATELVLVRHGASAAAVTGVPFPLLDGHSNPPLAPEGEDQAGALAERLGGEPIAGVYVSPLRRATQTAAPLAARIGVEPVVVGDLREVHVGEFEGGEFRIRVANRDPVIERLWAEERWDVIPGGEPMEEFARRVRAAADIVVAAAGPDCAAAVVTHGGVIAELCRQASGSRAFAFINVDNASISRIVVLPDGGWLLRSFNDIAHL
jgi:2,3-bisphosphoglycerate-dependent phosphoglycerate mutase